MRIMKLNVPAIVLVVLGALILFGKFGSVVGFLFAAAIFALGYYGVKTGKTFLGWLLMIVGGCMLMAKLSWLIGPLLGIVLIAAGVIWISGKKSSSSRSGFGG
ncbi:hypothetical protein [Saccharibacillus alkalitolerans]|uniref:ABC transporter permease n=1 Tax=Saccharibacillus alkalitolerans TaxID=2705290 RepID=A0ABX0F8V7_9BACL|nr:hypothetical protein [Saccharibacillus alkalitolerans]NGZ76865.1 hypothetical protein [Saccharibacillus alkalitolerans]